VTEVQVALEEGQPKESENQKKRTLAQTSILGAFESVTPYKFDNPKHVEISRTLVEMIALDNTADVFSRCSF
jgi:hypothetical protein